LAGGYRQPLIPHSGEGQAPDPWRAGGPRAMSWLTVVPATAGNPAWSC